MRRYPAGARSTRYAPVQARMRALTSAARSRWGKWPAFVDHVHARAGGEVPGGRRRRARRRCTRHGPRAGRASAEAASAPAPLARRHIAPVRWGQTRRRGSTRSPPTGSPGRVRIAWRCGSSSAAAKPGDQSCRARRGSLRGGGDRLGVRRLHEEDVEQALELVVVAEDPPLSAVGGPAIATAGASDRRERARRRGHGAPVVPDQHRARSHRRAPRAAPTSATSAPSS